MARISSKSFLLKEFASSQLASRNWSHLLPCEACLFHTVDFRVSFLSILMCYVTEQGPEMKLRGGKLTFDDGVVVHRVDTLLRAKISTEPQGQTF